MLHQLRQAAKGPLAEHVDWNETNVNAFNKTKEAMESLVILSATAPDLPHYLVVDTSKIATGAVFFAKSADKKLVIGIFSRKRTDCENKIYTQLCSRACRHRRSIILFC